MDISFDYFMRAFLDKVTEYEFIRLPEAGRTEMVDGFMRRSFSKFSEVCKYDMSDYDIDERVFHVDADIPFGELDEMIDIVSEGMVAQWMKPYTYHQDILENALNTTDFSSYSASELLKRITELYKLTERNFIMKMREYSYRHGDLTVLHL